jgi:hypothetical protein
VNAGQIIVIGLSVLLALWFLGGMWYNRRRARQIWRWLEPGLDVFGGQVGEPWIGRSGAGLLVSVDYASPPLRRLELIVRLLPRENAPLWLIELVQGKRDQLTFRVWLQSPDRGEIEAVRVGSALYCALQAQADHPWRRANESSHWAIYRRGGVKEEKLETLQELIDVYARQLQRYSKRRSEPHLFVQMSLNELTCEPSGQLLSRFKATLAS